MLKRKERSPFFPINLGNRRSHRICPPPPDFGRSVNPIPTRWVGQPIKILLAPPPPTHIPIFKHSAGSERERGKETSCYTKGTHSAWTYRGVKDNGWIYVGPAVMPEPGVGGRWGQSPPPPLLKDQLTLFQRVRGGGDRFCPTFTTDTSKSSHLPASLRWFRGRGPSIKRSHSSARQLSQCYYRGQVKVMDYIM
jgi:hypothetical protein